MVGTVRGKRTLRYTAVTKLMYVTLSLHLSETERCFPDSGQGAIDKLQLTKVKGSQETHMSPTYSISS